MPFIDRSRQQFSISAVNDHTQPAMIIHVEGDGFGLKKNNPKYQGTPTKPLPVTTPSATIPMAHFKSADRRITWTLSCYYEGIDDHKRGKIYIFLDALPPQAESFADDVPPDQVVVTVDNTDTTDANNTTPADDISVPVDIVSNPPCS
jgi:hypothetical protein